MADILPGVDPAVLADLQCAARAHSILTSAGERAEFWELVRAAKVLRHLLQPELPPKGTVTALREELQAIRRDLGPLIRKLRQTVKGAPNLPEAGERFEFSLAFLIAAPKEAQQLAKALQDPEGNLRRIVSKLSGMAGISDPYREALLPWQLQEAEEAIYPDVVPSRRDEPAGAPGDRDPLEQGDFEPLDGGPRPAAMQSPDASEVSPALLEDFRRAEFCRKIFQDAFLEIEAWEPLLLVVHNRTRIEARLEILHEARTSKQLARFHEETRALYADLLRNRSKYALWVRSLRVLVASIAPKKTTGQELDDAVSIMVASSGMQEKAMKWIQKPDQGRREAREVLTRVLGVARSCRKAVSSS